MAYALGMGRWVVGVSHECTFPAAARKKPVVSTSVIDPERMSSSAIDRAVSRAGMTQRSLYRIDEALVRKLRPDLLLTQSLCEVCATSPGDLGRVLGILSPKPEVLALHAHDLEGMFKDLRELARAAGGDSGRLERALRRRIRRVSLKAAGLPKKRVFCMEWLDPVYASGHWVPEMVELAGGRDELARKKRPSTRIEWSRVLEFAPEALILMPCGFTIERTLREMSRVTRRPGWRKIPAVRTNDVYLVEGPSYFNGAGPRLVEGLEILAEILHPEEFPRRRRRGVLKLRK
jgi:iron complex transport system substrate-binding protein